MSDGWPCSPVAARAEAGTAPHLGVVHVVALVNSARREGVLARAGAPAVLVLPRVAVSPVIDPMSAQRNALRWQQAAATRVRAQAEVLRRTCRRLQSMPCPSRAAPSAHFAPPRPRSSRRRSSRERPPLPRPSQPAELHRHAVPPPLSNRTTTALRPNLLTPHPSPRDSPQRGTVPVPSSSTGKGGAATPRSRSSGSGATKPSAEVTVNRSQPVQHVSELIMNQAPKFIETHKHNWGRSWRCPRWRCPAAISGHTRPRARGRGAGGGGSRAHAGCGRCGRAAVWYYTEKAFVDAGKECIKRATLYRCVPTALPCRL